MIDRLRGVLIEKRAPCLIIELSNGLGYEVEAPMSTFYRLPELGQSIMLYTHFSVKEEAHALYGFYEQNERALFRALIKVNGIGPKLALTILSSLELDLFVLCINNSDTQSLTRVPGIGKKTAERLIIEMRDRLSGLFDLESKNKIGSQEEKPLSQAAFSISSPSQEAISALVSLGYKVQEANKVIAQIDVTGLSAEAIIRQSLKKMMR